MKYEMAAPPRRPSRLREAVIVAGQALLLLAGCVAILFLLTLDGVR